MSKNIPSDVFHYRGLPLWSPLRPERLDRVLSLIPLGPGDRVVEPGCGHGAALLRVAARAPVELIAVDRSAAALEQVRQRFAREAPDARLTLLEQDAATLAFDPGSAQLVLSLGGPHAGGDLAGTIALFARWLAPGGHLLLGEGFWARDPDPAYLAATGLPPDCMRPHADTIALGRSQGLNLLYSLISDRDEWDHFEGLILHNWERLLEQHPDDEALRERVQGKRRWNDAQQRWGRDCMGFGLYLFSKPRG